jgi:16S rRNA (cytidine1402-2'-O)-methyltransferase
MPTLYLVATPIGNLEDLTFRALRVLGEVGLIAAEDTRVTRKLLKRHGIRTPMSSYHEHNKARMLPSLLATLKEKDVALVSDAGTPAISDPGPELVSAAAEAGVSVVPIPGASAVTSAIAVSGLAIDQFVYLGFLPRRKVERKRLLQTLRSERRALLVFETPHRLAGALADIQDALGDRRIAVCRELTKLHEEVYRGRVSGAIAHFVRPRGEFTLVIEGNERSEVEPSGEEDARELLAGLRGEGLGAKIAVARVVEQTGLPRKLVYRLWLEGKGQISSGAE